MADSEDENFLYGLGWKLRNFWFVTKSYPQDNRLIKIISDLGFKSIPNGLRFRERCRVVPWEGQEGEKEYLNPLNLEWRLEKPFKIWLEPSGHTNQFEQDPKFKAEAYEFQCLHHAEE